MTITTEHEGDVTVMVLPGDQLDASNADEVKRQFAELREGATKIVFDMRRIRFVDSVGCGAILSCLKMVTAEGGDLKLSEVTQPVRSVFELIRLHRICDIFETRDEAVAAFHG